MPRLAPSIYESSISTRTLANGLKTSLSDGIWVAISKSGIPAYSADGETWTEGDNIHTKGTKLTCVTHGGERFVAVGNQISVSDNGKSWTTKVHLACNQLTAVAHLDGLWICVGENGRKMHSTDRGETWSDGMTWYPGNYRAIAVGSGTFVAIGETLNGKGFINRTQNGRVWDGEQVINTPLLDVTFGAGRFVATDAKGRAHVSTDGISWTHTTVVNGRALHCIRYVNGVFLTTTGRGRYFWSLDGETWFEESGFLPRTVVYGGGKYLGSTRAGRFFSASGIDQWQQNREVPYRFVSFAYADHTTYVAKDSRGQKPQDLTPVSEAVSLQ